MNWNRMALGASMAVLVASTAAAQDDPQSVVIAGVAGTEGTWYKLTVEGTLGGVNGELDGFTVATEEDDLFTQTLVRGEVGSGDADGYRVLGTITSLELQHPARAVVRVNGEALEETGPDSAAASSDSPTQPPVFVWTPERPSAADLIRNTRPPLGRGASSAEQSDEEANEASSPAATAAPFRPDLAELRRPGLTLPTLPSQSDPDETDTTEPEDTADSLSVSPNTFSDEIVFFSGITGRRGEILQTIDLRDRAITNIGWFERRDKPCYIDVMSEAQGAKTWMFALNLCDNDRDFACQREICTDFTGLTGGAHGVNIPGQQPGITSIAVCTSPFNKERIKGMKISGAEIRADGSISGMSGSDSHELLNCSDWHPQVSCPQNTAATGVRAFFNPGSGLNKGISGLVGIELICRNAEPAG